MGLFVGSASISKVYVTPPLPETTFTVTIKPIAAALSAFPVYVNLANMPVSFWGTVTSDGGNIRCYAGSVEIPREVLSCNTSTQTGSLWILADLASAGTTLEVKLVAGAVNHPDTAPCGKNAVWAGHLWADHSTWQFDGLRAKVVVPVPVPGPSGVTPRTTSIWMNPVDDAARCVWGYGNSAPGELWEMARYNGSLIFHGYGDGYDTISIPAAVPLNSWTYCSLTFDGTNVKPYVNGVPMGSVTPLILQTASAPNTLGGGGFFAPWFGGAKEARMSAVARSDVWIATEFANQSAPQSFYSITEKATAATMSVPVEATAVYLGTQKVWPVKKTYAENFDSYGNVQNTWGANFNMTNGTRAYIYNGKAGVYDSNNSSSPAGNFVYSDLGTNNHFCDVSIGDRIGGTFTSSHQWFYIYLRKSLSDSNCVAMRFAPDNKCEIVTYPDGIVRATTNN
jgi:hypothetical protein